MIDELFKEGLLRKEPPSKEKARKSIETAEEYLEFARKNLEIELFKASAIMVYNSMFHAARAIAFKDGVVERSHFALIRYLLEKHEKEMGAGMLNKLDNYRRVRHSLNYGLESEANEDQAEKALEFAEEFIEKARELLEV